MANNSYGTPSPASRENRWEADQPSVRSWPRPASEKTRARRPVGRKRRATMSAR